MGTTANRSYPWPASTDSPSGATQIQALAEAIDSDVASIVAVPGWTTVGNASSITSTVAVNRDGRTVLVRGTVAPTTSWAANTSYTAVVTFPTGFRPSPSGPSLIRLGVGNSTNAPARLQLKSDGTVDMLTGSTAPTSIDLSVLSGFVAETT